MSIKANAGRQAPILATLTVGFADPTYGTAENAISLPPGAVVLGGDITVLTPFNGTTNTLKLGDTAVDNRYANAVDLKTAGRTALTLTGYKHAAAEFLRTTFAQTGTATAGAVRITVTYYVEKRAAFSQG